MARHFILGVDLGAHSVKVVQLETGFRQLRLHDCHELEIEPGDEPYLARAARALAKLVADHDLRDTTIYAALPGDQLSLRLLALPFSDTRKIEQVIGFELESQILGDIDEVVYDHTVVDHTPQGGARVLAAAARKTGVRELLERVAEGGSEPRALFAAPLVYDTLVDRFMPGRSGTFAIVDVGAERTNVAVIRGGRVVLARTIQRGGGELTRAVARTYRLAEAEAERVKRSSGFAPHADLRIEAGPHTQMAELMRAALAPLVRELRQTFALARVELGEPVMAAHLCGGGSQLHGLPEHLQEQLEIVVERLQIEGGPGFAQLADSEQAQATMPLALAVGLAGATGRREVDFRRGEFAYKADFSFLRAKATYLAACVLAVLACAALDAYAALHKLRQDETVLDQRLRAETQELFGEPQSDPEAVSKRIRQGIKMDELPVPAATAYDLLDEISKNMPAADKIKLDVTELEIKAKKTFLKGTTDSASAVDEIAAGLAKIPCFINEKGDSIQKGAITNVVGQQDLKQFTLTISSKCP
ncbi:MAG TPA: pilus assembly protein PilM [Polyangia bacterium]|nr:pilus assembly protein PilM [Polyangia bacterium]